MSNSEQAQPKTPEQQFKESLTDIMNTMKSDSKHPLRNLHAKEADPTQSTAYRDMAGCVRFGHLAGIPPGVTLALFAVKMDDVPINPIYNKPTAAISWTEILTKIQEFLNYTPKHITNTFSQGLVVKTS